MNWNTRYAVTAESFAQIQKSLPSGWFVRGHENGYVEPDTFSSFIKLNHVSLYNPVTNNEAIIYDHEPLFNANKAKRVYARHVHWNFLDHGEEITESLKHLDFLTTLINHKDGYIVDFRDSSSNHRDNGDIAAYVNGTKPRDIFFIRPSSFHYKNTVDPEKIPQSRKNRWVKEVLTHEVGHHEMWKNDNLKKFISLQKKWLYNSTNPLLQNQKMLDELTSCSGYGATNPTENYAEHFAAWMNQGNVRVTPNQFTSHVAKEMGWPTSQVIEEHHGDIQKTREY